MQEANGDIWNWLSEPHNCEVVIPTNIGWKADGSNVMGAGIAKQAILRYGRDIAAWYGAICRACRTPRREKDCKPSRSRGMDAWTLRRSSRSSAA